MQDIVWTPVEDDQPETQREILRRSLTEITHDVSVAMTDAGLNFPVYAAVPNSGEAVATIATPLDPSDADWHRASAIFCKIAGEKLGGKRLRGRGLTCAVANGPISADDIMTDNPDVEADETDLQ